MKSGFWRWFFTSSHPVAQRLRWGGVGLGLGISVFWMIVLGASFADAGNLYLKDSLQEYLAARAVLDGLSPYLPLPELAQRYVPEWPGPVLPHPTPHPPPAVLLALPLSWGSFRTMAWLWLGLELVVWLLWVWLVVDWWHGAARVYLRQVALVAALSLAWTPIAQDLIYEQWMIPLTLLTTLAWLAWRSGRPIWSGVALGLALSIKPIFWPLLVVLLLRRVWKPVVGALVMAAVWWGLAMVVMGPGVVPEYLHAGAAVAPYYRGFAFNFSVLSIGYRLFEGTGSPVLVSLTAPPLVNAPWLAPYASVLAGLLVLGALVWYQRHVDEDGAYAVGLVGSVLLSPVVWRHYFVLLGLPLVLMGRRLSRRGWPNRATSVWVGLVLLLGVPDVVVEWVMRGVVGVGFHQTQEQVLLIHDNGEGYRRKIVQ